MPTVTAMANRARVGDASTVVQLGGDTVHPALGIGVLVVVAVLSIYKPRGLTRYGQAKQSRTRSLSEERPTRRLPTSHGGRVAGRHGTAAGRALAEDDAGCGVGSLSRQLGGKLAWPSLSKSYLPLLL